MTAGMVVCDYRIKIRSSGHGELRRLPFALLRVSGVQRTLIASGLTIKKMKFMDLQGLLNVANHFSLAHS